MHLLSAAAAFRDSAQIYVGYEMLAESQRDLTPEQAAERLRASATITLKPFLRIPMKTVISKAQHAFEQCFGASRHADPGRSRVNLIGTRRL